VEQPYAFLIGPVEILGTREANGRSGLDKTSRHFVRRSEVGDAEGPPVPRYSDAPPPNLRAVWSRV